MEKVAKTSNTHPEEITMLHSLMLCSLLFIPLAAETVASDWPHYRGPNRDGIGHGKITSGEISPEPLWKASIGIGFTSIAVTGGKVYVSGFTTDQDTLHCLDALNGQPLWTYKYPAKLDPNMYEGGPNSTPAIADGFVYILGKQGHAACVDVATGKPRWAKNLAKELDASEPRWGFSGSPTVLGNTVYFNVGSHGCAVDAQTGKIIWKTGGDEAGYASLIPMPAVNPEAILVFTGNSLAGVHPKTGKTLWEHPWTTQYAVNAADPLFRGTQIFVSSAYNYGCALIDISSGKPVEVWRNQVMRNHFNASVLIDDHLYGVDEDAFKSMTWKTGKETWSQKGIGKGSLIAVDKKLIILSQKGELIIAEANPKKFTEITRAQILSGKCWSSPAFANGIVYCRNAAGTLVAHALK
jgi:outer membrane protein assembly factor BamB